MTDLSEIEAVLRRYKRVVVVGLSPDSSRPSNQIFQYLIDAGYDVVGVNPTVKGGMVADRRCYASLSEVPPPVEIVDVFRRSEEVPPIAEDAIRANAKVLWLQDGVTHAEAEARARQAGLFVVSNRCILRDHARLIGR